MKRILYIILGCLLTSIGAVILQHGEVMTGGTAGLSLLLSYASDLPFGLVFFLVNVPFYVLSIIFMGWNFTVSTILSVTLLSVMTGLDKWLPAFEIPMSVGAVVGGVFIGFGLSIMFMNRASLGGSNIVALILQKKLGWNPGKLNFLFDFVVVLYGFYSIGVLNGALSVLSIMVTSSIISHFKQKIGASNQSAKEKEASPSVEGTVATS
ncbi:YitT family protein [Domibacillus sp. DTU_2020_1001157_1_SI_ALB_TIR_016]|uniref:YitT family protein n=1 Tax=Domibacillus sp. DTU_2020_1001157_1_SI_ALB_TIR_016 TaxID=3077789 RepID=UPI0028ECA73F|nr:YitT family protein [Domibacillus sp. DTU_2020_1001157_1_SI_ALB_TIR_016]WNS78333.1 YitT family protein [Domibacillus sp. DTU_2020_1001157_1_SI_ALB_TIR_016]